MRLKNSCWFCQRSLFLMYIILLSSQQHPNRISCIKLIFPHYIACPVNPALNLNIDIKSIVLILCIATEWWVPLPGISTSKRKILPLFFPRFHYDQKNPKCFCSVHLKITPDTGKSCKRRRKGGTCTVALSGRLLFGGTTTPQLHQLLL